MNLEARPRELNIYAQPNQVLRFAYPVKNLDGTPYNEPYLTNVYLDVYTSANKSTPLKQYSFADGISHANNSNIIAYEVPILDEDLPMGKYYATITHERTISGNVENNGMFAGAFEITNDVRDWASSMEGPTNIANVIGLTEALADKLKYTVRTIGDGVNDEYTITVTDGNFVLKPPIINIYPFTGIDGIVFNNLTDLQISFSGVPALNGRMVAIGYIPL